MKKRVYIDTSVVGGYFDEEFSVPTKRFFQRVEKKEITLVVSDLMELELANAPTQVRQLLLQFPHDCFERIELAEDVVRLADAYISEGVVGKTSIEDCRHIALATVNNVDVLASWNFKHIVNLDRIQGYNSVNLKFGYPIIEIPSPEELVKYEN
ncbi:MAG: PIN domain protein [Ignavibacteriae bacterium]|nr:PIN domain protein [Ignavibacteriota bacterium]